MLKVDYAKKIAKAYFPVGENLENNRVSNFIQQQMRKNKSALEDLSRAAERVLAERVKNAG